MSRRPSRKQRSVNKRVQKQGGIEPRLVSFSASESFSGPLPPPDVLAQYNAILPNAANRIVTVFENQASHRISMETLVISADVSRAQWGLRFGFVLALLMLTGGIYLIASGKSVDGFAVLVGEAAILVGSFLYGRRQREKQLAEQQ